MEADFELQWSELAKYTGPNRRGHPRLARPRGVRRHVRPLIEYVDERLPDLTQVGDSCQKYPLNKGTFF